MRDCIEWIMSLCRDIETLNFVIYGLQKAGVFSSKTFGWVRRAMDHSSVWDLWFWWVSLEYSSDLGISLLFLRTQRSWIEVGLQDSTWDLNHFESCWLLIFAWFRWLSHSWAGTWGCLLRLDTVFSMFFRLPFHVSAVSWLSDVSGGGDGPGCHASRIWQLWHRVFSWAMWHRRRHIPAPIFWPKPHKIKKK